MNKLKQLNNPVVNFQDAPQLTTTEKEKVSTWREKREKNKSPFDFKLIKNKDAGDNDAKVELDFGKDFSKEQKYDLTAATYAKATGSVDPRYSHILITQTLNGQFRSEQYDLDGIANASLAALTSLSPADEIEGMIISKMLIFQNQMMHYSNKMISTDDLNVQERYLNNVSKLTRLYNESLDALNRYRRKFTEQRVFVTHQSIQVNSGGQAIVGNEVNAGAGECSKK